MTPDDVWRLAIVSTVPLVVLVIGFCALAAWPLLPMARQWMWISTIGLLASVAYIALDALNGWHSPWRLPILWGAIVAMGVGFSIQAREAWSAWKVRRRLDRM